MWHFFIVTHSWPTSGKRNHERFLVRTREDKTTAAVEAFQASKHFSPNEGERVTAKAASWTDLAAMLEWENNICHPVHAW